MNATNLKRVFLWHGCITIAKFPSFLNTHTHTRKVGISITFIKLRGKKKKKLDIKIFITFNKLWQIYIFFLLFYSFSTASANAYSAYFKFYVHSYYLTKKFITKSHCERKNK